MITRKCILRRCSSSFDHFKNTFVRLKNSRCCYKIESGYAPQLQLSGKFHYKSAAQSYASSKTHPLTRWNSPTGKPTWRTAPARQTDEGRSKNLQLWFIWLSVQPVRTPSMLSDRPTRGKQYSQQWEIQSEILSQQQCSCSWVRLCVVHGMTYYEKRHRCLVGRKLDLDNVHNVMWRGETGSPIARETMNSVGKRFFD